MIRLACILSAAIILCACKDEAPVADSGATKARASISAGADGLTTEQRNVKRRVEEDNAPGSVKHLYVISAYSGDVILYSTVKGKVTSSGKRLAPSVVDKSNSTAASYYPELLQDDGTYGSSAEYVYWWDVRDVYHQHYVAGGQILHVSSGPMAWPKIVLNLEASE